MGIDYCLKHERYFDPADGCPDCNDQKDMKPITTCTICNESIYVNQKVCRTKLFGLVHGNCFKKLRPINLRKMRPLTAAETYDYDKVSSGQPVPSVRD